MGVLIAIVRALKRIPFREVWLSVAVLLIAGENYPFSTFPMYASLSKESYYYMVTTTAGTPLAFAPEFRTRASFVSKSLRTQRQKQIKKGMSEEAAVAEAAKIVLKSLLDRAVPEQQPRLRQAGLKLVEVRIAAHGSQLLETQTTLAEIPPE